MTVDQGLWRPGLILLTTLSLVATQVLNVQRCGDPHCNGVVSEGRTLLKYHANSNSMLSFGKNQNVKIFSKGDGTQQDIWGVEIGGKRGFVNKRHVQEHRVMVRNIAYVAPPHASYQEIQLTGPEVTTAPPVQQPEQVQPQVLPTVPPPVAEPEPEPVTSTTAKPEVVTEAVTAKADDDKPELLEPTDPIQQQEEQIVEEQPEVPVKVLEMPPEVPHEPEIPTEIPIQEENPQLPIENEFQYQDQPLTPQEPIETQTEEVVITKDPEHIPFHLREDQETQTEALENNGVMDETIVHYIEFFGPFIPEWLHKSFHWNSVFGMSPTMVLFAILAVILIGSLVFVNFINIVVAKCTDNSHIKSRCAELDKALFKAKNELLMIKQNSGSQPLVSSSEKIKEVIKEIPSKAHLLEIENLKRDKSELLKQNSAFHGELEQSQSEKSGLENRIFGLTEELSSVKNQLDQAQQELSEAESVVEQCVEEKKRLNNVNNTELVAAIDTLRDQLNSQKEAVHKYEGKIKRRDSELKEKTQELRKLRAEAANAKLQVDKVASERDNFKSKIEALEAMETELTDRNSEMQVQLSVLESVQSDLKCANEKLDDKEAELEAVTNETAVLKETINSLKLVSNGGPKMTKSSDNGFESGDGWDVEDEVEIPDSEATAEAISEVDFEAICDTARLKVDLQKAQAACETLTEQLMSAEAAKETFEAEAKSCKIEAENARKAKETAMEERGELAKKHEVLSSYFNQREAELQKQLGVQTQRLGEVSEDSESVSKKLNLLYDELESYKEQCKSLKQEMEEQERSLKAQNAALEKKQHESWVTVRQETRKLTDAQNEMQTLRTRLTLAETKLAEKTVEIDKINEENRAMKETMDRINNHQIVKPDPSSKTKVVSFAPETNNEDHGEENHVYLNGGHDLPSLTSSGPGSITEELPPDLPLLPPMMPMMQTAPPPMMYPADNRPAPLGRRSPPHGGRGGRYSRSPSPTYGENRRSNYHRDVSPTPSDRSDRSSRYASSSYEYDEGRYSPPYPPRHRRRQSRDDRSPDRYSSRSERSDYEREYRNTPPRDNNRRRSSRDEDFPGSGRDYAHDYSRRDKRSDRVKERHGPKTSSPML